MSAKSLVFPISQHFSDYGFDPQIDYFQVLEAARKHKMETASSSMDALSFKLQKPISREDHFKKIKKSNNKKRWWKNALLFFKSRWADGGAAAAENHRVRPVRGGSISGPIYITESRSMSSTPYRKTSRPTSGPIAGTLTPAEKDEVQIPYFSLRDFDMDDDGDDGGDYYRKQRRTSTSAMPIYLVT